MGHFTNNSTTGSAEARSAPTWTRRLTGPIAATVVLIVFYVALLASLRDKSATSAEPRHAASSYAYWKYGDYRIDPENSNLPQRWLALSLLFGDFRNPACDSVAWQRADT